MDKQELLNKKSELEKELGQVNKELWDYDVKQLAEQLINADILVDDGVHNLLGGSYKKILMTASHNRDFDAESHDMVRVNNWQEAYDKIIEYADQIMAGKLETVK